MIMIFKKYENKVNTSIIKYNKRLLTKFFQKPIRNVNVYIKNFLINNNQSMLENKIKFNNTSISKIELLQMTNLNKKKII